MSRTLRRKPWNPVVKGALGKKSRRDKSCKPGCYCCMKDKGSARTERRVAKRKAMQQELKDS